MDDNQKIVADYWGQQRNKTKPISWLEHPTIRDFIHRRATGDPHIGTADWFKRKYLLQPAELALSLGCGFGDFDRQVIKSGIARKLHSNDISVGAIERARASAEKEGLAEHIEYSVLDLNEARLPRQTYDVILAVSSIHHVFRLEELFNQIRGSLKPGALFFLDEYIGPSRFQTSPFVTEAINRLLTILPERYRENLLQKDGSTIRHYLPSTVDHFEKTDPSEAVRSGEIMSTLRMYFDVVDYLPYGGTILHMLLSGITGNFDETSDTDRCMLNMLATFEELLEQCGAVKSDFAAIVCRPK
jgi:2-polyprenyl-3-methyl-5-hydroxy-6-metoxy-1,4-benzoquinol methylase